MLLGKLVIDAKDASVATIAENFGLGDLSSSVIAVFLLDSVGELSEFK